MEIRIKIKGLKKLTAEIRQLQLAVCELNEPCCTGNSIDGKLYTQVEVDAMIAKAVNEGIELDRRNRY